jgi:hypothetical protein
MISQGITDLCVGKFVLQARGGDRYLPNQGMSSAEHTWLQ